MAASATVDAPNGKAAKEAAAALEEAAAAGTFERAAQGNLDGAWEEIVGGNTPTERKVRITGGAFQPDNIPAGGIQKGRIYHVVVELRATGYSADDTLDAKTREPASTTETKKLRVLGGHFLNADEIAALNAATPE